MKKILLTGGSSLLGQQIITSAPCEIVAPSSLELDLSSANSIDSFDFKDYDCLILTAMTGGGIRHRFNEYPTELLTNNIQTNLIGNLHLLQKFLCSVDSGKILFVSSRSVYTKPSNTIDYWVSKLAIHQAIDALRKDYANFQFCVLTPGPFANRRMDTNKRNSQDIELLDIKKITDTVWFMLENNINSVNLTGKNKQ